MDYELLEAKHVRDFTFGWRFDDGVHGEIDLKPELYGPVFEPLLDASEFRKFSIHPEFRTLVWENGADLPQSFFTKKRKAAELKRIVGCKRHRLLPPAAAIARYLTLYS